ncbi:MAG: hypothetical protein HY781_11470 [Chloroflexi bacterium]|nr:hypothetical protein [Chloroflexota bacterium]
MKKILIPVFVLAFAVLACGLPSITTSQPPVVDGITSPTNTPDSTVDSGSTTAPVPPVDSTSTPTTSIPLPPPAVARMFVHVANASNIAYNYTYIDNPLTNNNPNALVFVTSNWNPGGVGGTYNLASIGVWYDTSVQKWSIFNQDISAMPENAAFNVWVPETSSNVFLHIATPANTSGHYTYIDNPQTNGNPNLQLQVTQNWNPGGEGGTYNNDVIGVWYDTGENKWSIYNQNYQAMPENAAFNVLIPSSGVTSFVHVAAGANIAGNYTLIDNPLTNGNPNALLQVTANWNPGGIGGTYDTASLGVWYSTSAGMWSIYNQDMSDMPVDAAFNMVVFTP